MPRLARWDDSFEFEDIAELIEIFRFGDDEGSWIQDSPSHQPAGCNQDSISDNQLDELVTGLKARAERAKRSPVTTTSKN
jgi:hypothetical protein